MTSEPIRVGIIGLGRSGWDIHAATLKNHEAYRIAAVADPEIERRNEASAAFGSAAYENWEQLLENPDIELVIVATPSHTHAEMSRAALRAGKDVVVEKPMTTSIAEADAMIACARENNRLLTVFQVRRVEASFMKIREIIERGVLGPLQVVRIHSQSYQRRRDWQTLRKFGGGQLNNTGPHMLDHALMLAGGVWHDLRADLRRIASAGDADDYARISFTGQAGIAFEVEVTNAVAINLPTWHITGKYGALCGDARKLQLRYFDPSSLPELVADEGPAANRSYSNGEELPWVDETIEIKRTNSFALFYDSLAVTIRHGAPQLVPPEESRNLMALLEACHEQANAKPVA